MSTTNLFTGTASIIVNVKAEKAWQALTDPAMIKQYLFGTEAVSDWKVGSSIIYKGMWEGKPYEDHGTILELIPNRLLKTSYWTAFSGREDTPENRLLVIYELAESDGRTTISITTGNNPSQEAADQATKNWATVLQMLKDLLEK